MSKNQTPYGHENAARRSPSVLAGADGKSNRQSDYPRETITQSPIDGTVILNVRNIYNMYRPAVGRILKENGAQDSPIAKGEGNVFHLTARFPDIHNAELALEAISQIIYLHRRPR